jgi:hypothetical protein
VAAAQYGGALLVSTCRHANVRERVGEAPRVAHLDVVLEDRFPPTGTRRCRRSAAARISVVAAPLGFKGGCRVLEARPL